jgi:hypothetical protein
MIIYSQPVFFAWFRHTLHTPASQGRAGANLNCRAKRLHHEGPARARLGLDCWGILCRPEPGHHTPFPLRQCLVDRAALAVTPAPPQSSPALA